MLPLLLPQLVQDLLGIGSASGHPLELLLVHVADFTAILLDRAVFGVKGLWRKQGEKWETLTKGNTRGIFPYVKTKKPKKAIRRNQILHYTLAYLAY